MVATKKTFCWFKVKNKAGSFSDFRKLVHGIKISFALVAK